MGEDKEDEKKKNQVQGSPAKRKTERVESEQGGMRGRQRGWS